MNILKDINSKNKPIAIIIMGQICSGKTTISKILEKYTHAFLLSADEFMMKQYHNNKKEYNIPEDDHLYHNNCEVIYEISKKILKNKINVILDCSFYKKSQRSIYLKKIKNINCIPYIINVKCKDKIIKTRLNIRNKKLPTNAFKIKMKEYENYKNLLEEPNKNEKAMIININNNFEYKNIKNGLINKLKRMILKI